MTSDHRDVCLIARRSVVVRLPCQSRVPELCKLEAIWEERSSGVDGWWSSGMCPTETQNLEEACMA